MGGISDDEWQNIHKNFETRSLLTAVDHIDAARGHLSDGANWQPPQIRTDLLKLHEMAMDVINYGDTDNMQEMFHMATHLEMRIDDIIESLEAVQDTLSKLTEFYPESLSDS